MTGEGVAVAGYISMHLHPETSVNAKSDCSILSLSWMGRVPDDMPEVSQESIN